MSGCLPITAALFVIGIQYNALFLVKVIEVAYLPTKSLPDYHGIIAK